jgi:hypothetical protein
MKICIEKASNKIIEMQSDATAGTLIANAIRAGYAEKDIEEREVTTAQYASAKAVCPVHIKNEADKLKAIADKAKVEQEIKEVADDKLIDAIKDVEGVKEYLKKLVKVIGGVK